MKTKVIEIKPLELELIRVWVKGYVSALVDNDWVTEGQDLYYSY